MCGLLDFWHCAAISLGEVGDFVFYDCIALHKNHVQHVLDVVFSLGSHKFFFAGKPPQHVGGLF